MSSASSSIFTLSVALLLGALSGCEEQRPRRPFDPVYDNPTFVPTADEVIEKMFELAKLGKDDVLFDLGSGDGRVLYQAAKKFGCRGVGLELNPVRIREAMDQAEKYQVGTLVEIRHADALRAKDIADATVVYMYMHPEFLDLWFPTAKKILKPGTRIVSHDYCWTTFGSWAPTAEVMVKSQYRDNHRLYLWIVPEKKSK